jgi:hypothetical protein
MLMLPTGQVIWANGTQQLYIYTPDGNPDPSWAPAIAGIQDNGDGTFLLSGTQLNGISEGAGYGDDAQMSSNYPIVQLTDSGGNVSYARTFSWSNTGVATGDALVSTEFTLPGGIPPGDYSLSVIANGIASNPVPFTVSGNSPATSAHRLSVGPFVVGTSGTAASSALTPHNEMRAIMIATTPLDDYQRAGERGAGEAPLPVSEDYIVASSEAVRDSVFQTALDGAMIDGLNLA